MVLEGWVSTTNVQERRRSYAHRLEILALAKSIFWLWNVKMDIAYSKSNIVRIDKTVSLLRGALRDSGPSGCEGDYKTVQYCAIQQWYNVASTECVNVLTPEYFDSTFRYLYSIQLQCAKIASIFISCWIVFHNKCTRSAHGFICNSTLWFD